MRRLALAALLIACLWPVQGQAQQLGTVVNTGAISCPNGSTTAVVAANPSRLGLYVKNNGANLIYVGTGTPAALTSSTGYPLIPTTATMPPGERDFIGYTGALLCIAVTGATELRYIEFLK